MIPPIHFSALQRPVFILEKDGSELIGLSPKEQFNAIFKANKSRNESSTEPFTPIQGIVNDDIFVATGEQRESFHENFRSQVQSTRQQGLKELEEGQMPSAEQTAQLMERSQKLSGQYVINDVKKQFNQPTTTNYPFEIVVSSREDLQRLGPQLHFEEP